MNKARLKNNIVKYSKDKTQADLAREIDVTQVSICRWFSGQRVPHLLGAYRLCKALGITVEQLMEGVDE